MIPIKVHINRNHEDEWKYPKDTNYTRTKQLETVGDEHENPCDRLCKWSIDETSDECVQGVSEEDMRDDLRPKMKGRGKDVCPMQVPARSGNLLGLFAAE